MLKAEGIGTREHRSKTTVQVEAAIAATGAKLTNDQTDDLVDRNRAYELFRQDHPLTVTIQKSIDELKSKFQNAKSMGERIGSLMKDIDKAKAVIQQRRLAESVRRVSDGEHGDAVDDGEVIELQDKMNRDKQIYGATVSALKQIKAEIEHIQRFLSKSTAKMQSEFERGWGERQRPAFGEVSRVSVNPKIGDASVDADIDAFYTISRQLVGKSR
eukprot:CRZ02326.1 hypothetical protein [Spongospora subterranea]